MRTPILALAAAVTVAAMGLTTAAAAQPTGHPPPAHATVAAAHGSPAATWILTSIGHAFMGVLIIEPLTKA